ncbi:P-loop containing nucleoside triphosphate hydrolase protein, partial [Cubamyces sp. BRFM 1775]
LVIDLFGPPGVGKTLSAEASSEHLRRPLYILDSGELGATPGVLDEQLTDAFELAAHWKAVLPIDEADVFLEKRAMHDLLRNAMVTVLLRQVEYHRGILFLTTNRITTFDDAFLSRIHIALHFTELAAPASADEDAFSDDDIVQLAARVMNGRQIKNVCRTASLLARSRGENLQYEHLAEAFDAMQEFLGEFAALRRAC